MDVFHSSKIRVENAVFVCSDICTKNFIATAQSDGVHIYDIKNPTKIDFLPYHFLMVAAVSVRMQLFFFMFILKKTGLDGTQAQ